MSIEKFTHQHNNKIQYISTCITQNIQISQRNFISSLYINTKQNMVSVKMLHKFKHNSLLYND